MAFEGCALAFAHFVLVFALVVQLHQACVARPVALRGLRGFVVPERYLSASGGPGNCKRTGGRGGRGWLAPALAGQDTHGDAAPSG